MTQGSLAERLRVLRARRGLTLTKASEQIGISRHTLRGLELGGQEPHYPTLRKIADGYGVPVEELLEQPALHLDEAPATGLTKRGFPDVRGMDDEELNALRARAREDDAVFDALVKEHAAVQENVIRLREQDVSDEEMGDLYERHVRLRKLWKVALFERLHSVPATEWPGRKPEAPTYPDTTGLDLDIAYDVWRAERVPVGAR
jgi:transcriptional regulator with XRE-family HTH domain